MASLATAFVTLVAQWAPNTQATISAEASRAGLASGVAMGSAHGAAFDNEATKSTKAGVAKAGGAATDEGKRQGGTSGSAFGGAFSGALTGFLAGGVITKVINVFGEMRNQAIQASKTLAQTNAVIASTKGAAGISAEALGEMTMKLSNLNGMEDDYIKKAANVLLTFTNVKGAIFQEALPAILDLSVAMKEDASTAALQVGKALNDPIKGMTALRREGVLFTDAQIKVVKAMVATGDIAGAQKIILKELATEFGGSAAAQATAADKLHASWQNLLELLGTKLLPIVGKVVSALVVVVQWMTRNSEVFVALIVVVAALTVGFIAMWIAALGPVGLVAAGIAAVAAALIYLYLKFKPIKDTVDWFIEHWKIFAYIGASALGPLGPLVVLIATHFSTFKAIVEAVASSFIAAWQAAYAAFTTTSDGFIAGWDAIRNVGLSVASAVITAWQAVHDFFVGVASFFVSIANAFVAAYHTIADATVWLWQTIIEPTWNVIHVIIQGVWLALKILFVAFVVALELIGEAHVKLFNIFIKPYWDAIVALVTAAWDGLKSIFTATINFLAGPLTSAYEAVKNFILATFKTISTAAQLWWDGIKFILTSLMNFLAGPFATAWTATKDFLINTYNIIKNALQAWWDALKVILNTLLAYLSGPFAAGWTALKDFLQATFNIIRNLIQTWWDAESALFNTVINFLGGVFSNAWLVAKNFVLARWQEMQDGIGRGWNYVRDNIFTPFVNFIKDTIPAAFNTGVEAVKAFWFKIEGYAKEPVNFVISPVYSHIRDLWNGIASKVGVPELPFVSQFSQGGAVWGAGTATSDSIPAKLSNGEYVIRARAVEELGTGFLDMLNAAGGPRPNVRQPGDGSEGIAFADGGLVGWLARKGQSLIRGGMRKVVEAFVNETVNPLIDKIPGNTDFMGGAMRGGAHKLVNGLLDFLKRDDAAHPPAAGNFGPITASIAGAQQFVRAQAGKPYVWAAAGPDGYDCSGLVSAVYKLLRGQNPYGRLFSTMDEANYFVPGDSGDFRVGWANGGERGGGDVGHTAGNVGGLAFEATPPVVRVGNVYAKYDSFAHVGHMAQDMTGVKGLARGGLVGEVMDSGGVLRPGHFGLNLSGKPEVIETLDQIEKRNADSADIIEHLKQLIEAVYTIAPNMGDEINMISRGLRLKGRTRGQIHGGF